MPQLFPEPQQAVTGGKGQQVHRHILLTEGSNQDKGHYQSGPEKEGGPRAQPPAAVPVAQHKQGEQQHHIEKAQIDDAQHDAQRPQGYGVAMPIARIVGAHRGLSRCAPVFEHPEEHFFIGQIIGNTIGDMPKIVSVTAVTFFFQNGHGRLNVVIHPFIRDEVHGQQRRRVTDNQSCQQKSPLSYAPKALFQSSISCLLQITSILV